MSSGHWSGLVSGPGAAGAPLALLCRHVALPSGGVRLRTVAVCVFCKGFSVLLV